MSTPSHYFDSAESLAPNSGLTLGTKIDKLDPCASAADVRPGRHPGGAAVHRHALPGGVATIANWAANFVVTISFLSIKNAIGGMGVFLLFGALTLVALRYFWRQVPETKGRSLQELEQELAGRAVG